jgi:hypothetical protein
MFHKPEISHEKNDQGFAATPATGPWGCRFEAKSRLIGAKPHKGEEVIPIMMLWWILLT